jgi:hypothetical protein
MVKFIENSKNSFCLITSSGSLCFICKDEETDVRHAGMRLCLLISDTTVRSSADIAARYFADTSQTLQKTAQ